MGLRAVYVQNSVRAAAVPFVPLFTRHVAVASLIHTSAPCMIAQQRAMQSKLGPEAIQSLAERTFEDTWELSGLPAQHKAHIWQRIAQQHTGRAYHNIGHLLSMFEFIRKAGKSGYQLQQPAAVHWAIWFHDIIYKPGSADSEQLSADLAKQLLTQAGSSQQVVDAVVGHIMSTQGHRHLPGDTDNALFLDADLSILATGFNRYVEYSMAVRKEYEAVPEEQFIAGRCSVLKGLIDREQLFASEYGRALCETAARANLAYEWRLLYSGRLLQHSAFDEGMEDAEGNEGEQ